MQLNQSTRRLQWLLWGFVVWTGLLFGRLIWLQVIRHDDYLAAAQSQQQRTVELAARRGSILDRNGQPLAMTLEADSLALNPQRIEDLPQAANLLAAALDLDRATLLSRIRKAKQRELRFMWVARKLTPEESRRARALKLNGLEFRKEMRRYYPRETLAAHVLGSIGFIEADDVAERGNGGIELALEKDLGGITGEARLFTDSRQNSYDQEVLREPVPGAEITLTLDPNLQFRAEKELAAAVTASGAEAGSVVAMDPYTGEVLAMASYPTFDPNLPPTKANGGMSSRMNVALSRTFEPGSVFKVITLAAGLENTRLRPDSMIDCGNGQLNLFGRVIHDHDSYSSLTMAGVLAKSSNIGAIRIALATGDEKFYEYQKRFGFGAKTGLPLPGESAGIVYPPSKWTKSSIGSLAMGHEIGVTAVQLARAGAVIANGGMRVQPRLLQSRKRIGEPLETFQSEPGVRVLKPETAIEMRRMMEGVVLEGTGSKAVLQGYTSAGKTGSAQIYDPELGVYTHTYNASFLGFAPVGNPRVVVAVTLHGTRGGSTGFGGVRAAPVFREVAMTALRMLEVPKDLPDTVLVSKKETNVSDLASAGDDDGDVAATAARLARLEETSPELARGGSAARSNNPSERDKRSPNKITQDGTVLRARAVSSVTLPLVREGNLPSGESFAGQRPFLGDAAGPSVPDFFGMTKRAVLEESIAAGIEVEFSGEGLAAKQDPPPGAAVRPGTAVKVSFAR